MPNGSAAGMQASVCTSRPPPGRDASRGNNAMNDTRDNTNDRDLARLCELLERASTPERRTDVAIRLCNALGIPCAGGN